MDGLAFGWPAYPRLLANVLAESATRRYSVTLATISKPLQLKAEIIITNLRQQSTAVDTRLLIRRSEVRILPGVLFQ
ncbi:hypothetical protein [Rubinisphaera sp.]|uniref:hypothetical protein n=1 Tax=Rubinisphaera sp. TaxID=2024857 RepID=UPI0025E7F636|nr:hypothetical protein [Rubinisphaera sp.]